MGYIHLYSKVIRVENEDRVSRISGPSQYSCWRFRRAINRYYANGRVSIRHYTVDFPEIYCRITGLFTGYVSIENKRFTC